MAFKARGGEPPAQFGSAPPGAAARTGRIDEDARRPAPPVGEHVGFLPGIEQPRLDARRTGALGAWRQLLEARSEEHTSELQSLMRISYAVFCLKKKKQTHTHTLLFN